LKAAGNKQDSHVQVNHEIKGADTVNFSLFMVDKDGKEQPMVKLTYKSEEVRPRDRRSFFPVFKGDDGRSAPLLQKSNPKEPL
jgi:hypothetical protein